MAEFYGVSGCCGEGIVVPIDRFGTYSAFALSNCPQSRPKSPPVARAGWRLRCLSLRWRLADSV